MIATLSAPRAAASPRPADPAWRLVLHAQRRRPCTIGKAQVTLPPGSFLQATAAGEEALAALVGEHAGRAKRIADLFCGIGPFALRLAEQARVAAFDSDEGAVAALRKPPRATPGLKPVKAEARDLFRRPLMPPELRDYDAVVFDPPRQGAQAQAQRARRQQGAGRHRRLLQCGYLCPRRERSWSMAATGSKRHAGRPIPLHAACRTGGAIFTPMSC